MARTASLLSVVLLLLAGKPCGADSAQEGIPEYRLKAAYIYKILPFVHWPDGSGDKETLTVGVFGKEAHEAVRQLLDGKIVKGKDEKTRKIRVARLSGENVADIKNIDEYPHLQECQVVFISASCGAPAEKILGLVRDQSVLTFGESGKFLTAGGVINFVPEGKKVRFEINLEAAKRARLKIDSQLLRLAKRVVRKQ